MKIYVKFEPPATVGEFLIKFFTVTSPYNNVIMNGQTTYFDKECTVTQCQSSRMRSFDDLFDIVSTYYPEILPKDLMHEILVADIRNKDNKKLFPHLYNCGSIARIRIIYYIEFCTEPFTIIPKYKSKYSWAELLNMLGISNNAELEEYANKNRKVVKPNN